MRFLFLIFCTLAFFAANADPRIEEECHFVYDPDDADNEVKEQNCTGGWINTQTLGGTEYAFGEATLELDTYLLDRSLRFNARYPVIYGEDAFPLSAGEGVVQANSDCVLVTRNWDNGNQAYNYTEYRTRNWYATVSRERIGQSLNFTYKFKTVCRNALEQ